MAKKLIPMAVCYDFDGTLSPGNMQEYDFMAKLGISPKVFWQRVNELAKKQGADNILAYMKLMIKEAEYKDIPFRREDFRRYGKTVKLYNGTDTWFKSIKAYAKGKGIDLKHYIISSGLKEMIEGTTIAKEFAGIFASSFMYNSSGIAEWPAVALNYTSKTQYLYRLNKGCMDISDDKAVNKYVPEQDRPLPFANMIYIGDGDTDIPCMRMVKAQGGHSIAVYPKGQKDKKTKAKQLIADGRVNTIAIADYSEGKEIDVFIKTVIDAVAAKNNIKPKTN